MSRRCRRLNRMRGWTVATRDRRTAIESKLPHAEPVAYQFDLSGRVAEWAKRANLGSTARPKTSPTTTNMQKVILALAFGTAAAFVPASVSRSAPLTSARDELIALGRARRRASHRASGTRSAARACRPARQRPDRRYLRHAEIKHGRIAMAGFLGRAVPRRRGASTRRSAPRPRRGRDAAGAVDNIPVIGKLQILTFVGMLESYGEIPGDVPRPRRQAGLLPADQGQPPGILFDLYKPFDIFPEQTEEEKARGRLVEVNTAARRCSASWRSSR